MAKTGKPHVVSFKVSDEEYDLLSDEAKKRKLSVGQTARIVLLEALSGYDQKQEYLMRRLDLLNDKLDEKLGLLISISSLGAAAGALPFDADQRDAEEVRKKLRSHITDASELGKNIVEMIKKGKL
jgi:hypothetical protein